MGIIITLVILSVLVLIHEWGHFTVARWFKIKVEEFGFGLPLTKALWSRKVGETRYSFYPALIGGFVKLLGEDEAGAGRVEVHQKGHEHYTKEELKHAFFARPVYQRALVVVAGVVMNAVLAFAIYYLYLGITSFETTLPLLAEHRFFGVNQVNVNLNDNQPVVTYVSPNSPAEKAGLKPSTRIVAINNIPVKTSDEVIAQINKNKGKTLQVTWEELHVQDNKLTATSSHTGTLVPRLKPPQGEGPTGIAFLPVAYMAYETPMQKALSGIVHPINLMDYNFVIMKKLISVSFEEKTLEPVSQGVSGPVGILALGGTINEIPDPKERLLNFLNLAGILSISLAFFNLLPIPGLDGGRFYLILFEGIFGKKLNPRIEGYIHTAGMAILIGLIILVTFKDVLQFFF